MLPLTLENVRLYLHVLAATVWVGGQITLAGLVPTLRGIAPDAPRAAARQFNRIAWPAFAVLFVTGLWNISELHVDKQPTSVQVTLLAKLLVVALAGVSAGLHAGARTRRGLAVWGALSGLSALGALLLGIQLHG